MPDDLLPLMLTGTIETLYMITLSSLMAFLLGFPLGIILVITAPNHIWPLPHLHNALGTVINATRSFPFIILIVVLLPLSRLIVGTTLGATAAVVPLAVGSAPFVARLIENSLKEVERGKIEAAIALGASPLEIVGKVLIPEALASLIRSMTLAVITITSFTATAGAIGAGGLGSLAIRYGYMRYRDDVMIATIVALILLVQGFQWGGNLLARSIDRRRHQFG
ncbi:methionine ABC transporter permease [Heliophilum fasciatum]|uniref:D-methionine transport system permease protein n=1 Tax=Heliophilum fasciatum TaxID=35700 RepID=A0A4R2RKF8_9FIRM|nr:methionine ABC transporter permease [Heliophilum fasciatum]MCW2278621.1 D-methionine transport system permease protein [Heliophilum fasciatum]TCP62677.1 D-methionine transport system permease protein [Heliophilum fasciatum]